MTFYQSVLGGELTISTFGDIPMEGTSDEIKDNVMHSQLESDSLTSWAPT
jgi:PhnB protein